MESRKRTPLLEREKFFFNNNSKKRVQSYSLMNKYSNNPNNPNKPNIILPLINRPNANLMKNSSIKNLNIKTNINKIKQNEVIFINSFSEGRLPPEYKDLSYDNPYIE